MYDAQKGCGTILTIIYYSVFVRISRDLVGVVGGFCAWSRTLPKQWVWQYKRNGRGPKFSRALCTRYLICPTSISYKVGNYALISLRYEQNMNWSSLQRHTLHTLHLHTAQGQKWPSISTRHVSVDNLYPHVHVCITLGCTINRLGQ